MKVLLVSADLSVREQMALCARSIRRVSDGTEPFELLEAADGVRGIEMAWRHRPDVVVADQIMSRAGAFAVTKDLKGSQPPFAGRVVILLERAVDEWLAKWAEADAWFVKPVDPFALADAIRGFGLRGVEARTMNGVAKEAG